MDRIGENGKMAKKEIVKDDLKTYWNKNAEKYGDSPKAFDWGSRTSQVKRFEVLCDILPRSKPFSVLDVGCGLGDLQNLMAKWGLQFTTYTGVDISPKMIELARKKYPGVNFVTHDMATSLNWVYDYVLLSGTLNKRIADTAEQYAWAYQVLKESWAVAEKGMAFNMLSTYADHTAPDDFQYQPSKILEFCMGLSRWVKLDHTYMPHDFTVYLWRDQP